MSTTTIVEKTTDDDRLQSIRTFVIESEIQGAALMPARRQMICLSAFQSEDISLDGEDQHFEPLPGEVIKNAELAAALLTISHQLITTRINRFPV